MPRHPRVWRPTLERLARRRRPRGACRSDAPRPEGLAWISRYVLHAALVLVCLATPVALPRSAEARAPDLNLADVVAQVMPTAVAIVATTVETQGQSKDQPPKVTHERGSGFIVDPAGYIVTNKHVVTGASDVSVTLTKGTVLPATIVGESSKADIAVLRVEPRRALPTARWGDSNKVRVGDTVIAIGNPLGFDNSVSAGIVSALNRNIMESPFDDYIQTDAAINHGNSGGPLFNMKGEVVGMNSVIFAPNNGGFIGLGFAIPSNDVRFVVDQIRRFGFVRAGHVGMQFQDVSDTLRQSLGLPIDAGGAIVVEVDPADTAAAAGLRVGDVVLRVRNERVTDARALARSIAASRVGAKAPIEVWRDGTVQKFDVAVTQAPEAMPSGPTGASYPRAAAESMAKGLGLALEPAAPTPNPPAASPATPTSPSVPPVASSAPAPSATASAPASSPPASAPASPAPSASSSEPASPASSSAASSPASSASSSTEAAAPPATSPSGPDGGAQPAANPLSSRTRMDGARVTRVDPGGAAAQAGLKVGDVIVMTERGGVSGPLDVMRALDSARMANKEYAPILVRGPDGAVRWTALSTLGKGTAAR